MSECFERKVLIRIYGAENDNGLWRRRHNFELYRIYQKPDIIKHIKIGRLRWIGHVMRMEQNDPVIKTLLDRPIGQRRSRIRFLDNIDEDMRNMGIRALRRKVIDRDDWREILENIHVYYQALCR
ncbi:uncharacterized protein [Diabrotica undecimpunctata]|uniref:uncharacterized protein isoform X3 n=1 Tax=Diabrotica undecimpunctata TaxID=50387 RepID=UPI003B63EB00